VPRTRTNEREKWEQLAAAVLELRKHVEAIEARLNEPEYPKGRDTVLVTHADA
jgi:hypothetical protein